MTSYIPSPLSTPVVTPHITHPQYKNNRMFVTIVLACLVLCLLLLCSVMKYKPRNFPPGPLCLPVVGCVPFLPSKHLHLRMELWLKQYGPVVGLMLGSQPAVLICGPHEVQEAMRREEFQGRPEKANFRQENFNRKLGVFFSDGPFWVEQRRFTLRHLKDLGFGKSIMEASISEEIEDVIKELRQCEVLQVSRFFGLSTVNVIWALVAGTRYSRGDACLQALLHALTFLFRTGSQTGGIVNAVPVLKIIAPQLTGHRETLEHVTNLKAFFKNIIREHDKTFKENDLRDFIDVYLKEMKYQSDNENSTFSEDGLIITCFDLFSAGAESVSNTLSFSLLYTVLHPEVQRMVQHLLDYVVGRDRRPCLDDRPRLQYVEAVLEEVMRINTVAPVAPAHRVTRDTTLNGYNIPKLLEPSRSHNYNDTSVHIIHIGFPTLDSCCNQYIKVAQSYHLPQQDRDFFPLRQSLIKQLKPWNSATSIPSSVQPFG